MPCQAGRFFIIAKPPQFHRSYGKRKTHATRWLGLRRFSGWFDNSRFANLFMGIFRLLLPLGLEPK
jgi:hypothetical protein